MRAPLTALSLVGTAATHAPVAIGAATQPTTEALGWLDVADELRAALLERVRATPRHRMAHVAFVVREDGVEVLEREDLAQHYKRHGLRDLVQRVRQVPPTRALFVLEGDEVAVLSCDAEGWLVAAGELR